MAKHDEFTYERPLTKKDFEQLRRAILCGIVAQARVHIVLAPDMNRKSIEKALASARKAMKGVAGRLKIPPIIVSRVR